jgi:hypothetical protein
MVQQEGQQRPVGAIDRGGIDIAQQLRRLRGVIVVAGVGLRQFVAVGRHRAAPCSGRFCRPRAGPLEA